MSDRADRRRRSNVRQYSAEDQALNQISKEADLRLQARRAARAEAREIRLKEIEKQQKEAEERQDRLHGLNSDAKSRQLSGSRRNSTDSSESMESNRDRERDLKGELRELEDKYKQAMMTSATLDNEKQTLVYQLELLKDQIEEMEEAHVELNREHKDRCRELEMKKRAYSELEAEVKILKEHMVLKDQLIEESGFVIMSTEDGQYKLEKNSLSNGPVPSGGAVLLSTESISLLKEAGDGSLGTDTSPLRSSPPVHDTKPDSGGKTCTTEPGSLSGRADGEDRVEARNEEEVKGLATGKDLEEETRDREDRGIKDESKADKIGDAVGREVEDRGNVESEEIPKEEGDVKIDDEVLNLDENNSQVSPGDSGSVVSPELVTEPLLTFDDNVEVKDDIGEGVVEGSVELEKDLSEAQKSSGSDGKSVDDNRLTENTQNDELTVIESEVDPVLKVENMSEIANLEVEKDNLKDSGEAKIDSEIKNQNSETSKVCDDNEKGSVVDDNEKGSVVDEESEAEFVEPVSGLALNLVKENLEGLPRDDSGIFSPDDVSTSHTGFSSDNFNVKIVEPDTDEDVEEFFDAVSTPSPFLQDKSAAKYQFEEEDKPKTEDESNRGSKSESSTSASDTVSEAAGEGSEVDPVGKKTSTKDVSEEKLVVEGAVVTESDVDVGTVHEVGLEVEGGTSVDPVEVGSTSATEDLKEDGPQKEKNDDESVSEVEGLDDIIDKQEDEMIMGTENLQEKEKEKMDNDSKSVDQLNDDSENMGKQDEEVNQKSAEDKMEDETEESKSVDEKETENEYLVQSCSKDSSASKEEEAEEEMANSEIQADEVEEKNLKTETEVQTRDETAQEENQDGLKSEEEKGKSEVQTEEKPLTDGDPSRNEEKEQDGDLQNLHDPVDSIASELERNDEVQEPSEDKDETPSESSPKDVGFQDTGDASEKTEEGTEENKTGSVLEDTPHKESLRDVSENSANFEGSVGAEKVTEEKDSENPDAIADKKEDNEIDKRVSNTTEDQTVDDKQTVETDQQTAENNEQTVEEDVEQSADKEEQGAKQDEQEAKKDEQSVDKDNQSVDKDEQSVDKDEHEAKKDEKSVDKDEQSVDKDEQSVGKDEQEAKKEEQEAKKDEKSMDKDEQSVDKDEQEAKKDEKSLDKDEQEAKKDEQESKKDEQSADKDEQEAKKVEQEAKNDIEEAEVKNEEQTKDKPVAKTDDSDDEVFVKEVKMEEPESPLPSPNKKSGTSMKSEGELSEDDLLNDAYSFDDIDEVLEDSDEPTKLDPPLIVIDKPESESDQTERKSSSDAGSVGSATDDAAKKRISDTGSLGSDVQEDASSDRASTGSGREDDTGSTGSLEAAGASAPLPSPKEAKKGKKFGKFFKHIFK